MQEPSPNKTIASAIGGIGRDDRFFCCEFFVFRKEDQAVAAVA